jgi:FecR protein
MESKVAKPRRLEVYWFTVSYTRLFLWIAGILLFASLGGFALFKDYVLAKLDQMSRVEGTSPTNNPQRNGRFMSIIGTVKVKKADAIQWTTADMQTVLESGDYIQASSDAYAKIIFPEGTTYLMKPDSLIVVQENSEDPQTAAKKVSVRVTSGSIDLSTARRDTANSTTEVSAAFATAQVEQESRVRVESNPATKSASFLVHKGRAKVAKGTESYEIGAYESVTARENKLTKERVMAPPDLLAPNNIKPIIAREGVTRIDFSWSPVAGATAYRIRVSNSMVFSKVLREEVIRQGTRYSTSGLEEGTYYWAVSSVDVKNNSSRESDPNKFTVINKSSRDREADVFLSVDQVLRISNIFEIIGRTDPGASVLVNEEPVPLVAADGSFKHFTSPLPHKGKNIITITAQDRSGNLKTLKREVFID